MTDPTPAWLPGSRPTISGRTWPRSRRRSMTKSWLSPGRCGSGDTATASSAGGCWSARRRIRLDRHGGLPAIPAGPSRRRPAADLVVQLDHLGDAVLSTPLIAELRVAYPEATIDVLASPSNHEVFEADPNVDRVWIAERTWFERRPDRWAVTAVWSLGRSLRRMDYDLGIDVRGDVLTVVVLALAGARRRVGWAMGGGAFLLTDVADWIPGRHEVRSRLALLSCLGITPDASARVDVHATDEDRVAIARRLADAWPRRALARRAGGPGPRRDVAAPTDRGPG